MTKMLGLLAIFLWSCSPVDSWDRRVPDYHTPCPQWAPIPKGPDAYDEAHGKPFHCEKARFDENYQDVDNLEMW